MWDIIYVSTNFINIYVDFLFFVSHVLLNIVLTMAQRDLTNQLNII